MCGFLQDLQACADGPAFEPVDRRACAGFRHTSMALPTGIEPLDTFRRGDTPTTHDRVMSYELWNYADRVMNGILFSVFTIPHTFQHPMCAHILNSRWPVELPLKCICT